MNCPACGTRMTEVTTGDVKVQACKGGCGGLWFDEWALKKVDRPDQSVGEALLHIERNPSIKVDNGAPAAETVGQATPGSFRALVRSLP